ncbi:MAG: ASCH domain-containing protein [Bacteroidales bacterium]|jgi:predicted transcriptional regulator|nr:ASCH domain-containing protein [Bacteroidales bacterium]
MNVLLSIKPEFANKIFNGTKKYEFRKSIFKKDVKKVIVYASSPVQRVIGEFDIIGILCKDTESLWHETKKYSGITKDFYDEYFANKEMAYAIKVGTVRKYSCPKYLSDFDIEYAPQSFAYL